LDDYWEPVHKRIKGAKKSEAYVLGLKRSIRTTRSPNAIKDETGRPLPDLVDHMVCVKAKRAVAFLRNQGRTDISLSSFKKRFGNKAHYRKKLNREVATIGRGAHVFTYKEVAKLVNLSEISEPDWL
jgi:hypothetical protein